MSGNEFDSGISGDKSAEEGADDSEFASVVRRVILEDAAEIESYAMPDAKRDRLFRKIGFERKDIKVKSTNFAVEFMIDSAQGAYSILHRPAWVGGMTAAVSGLAFVVILQMQATNLQIYGDVYNVQDAIVMRSSADSQPMTITATVADPVSEVSIWQKRLVDEKIEHHFTYKEDGVIELVFFDSAGSQKLLKDLLGTDISGSKVVLILSPQVLLQ